MVNSFSAIARRQNRQIDVAIRNVNCLAMLTGFPAARNFLESECGFVKFRKLFSVLGQQCDVSNSCHGYLLFVSWSILFDSRRCLIRRLYSFSLRLSLWIISTIVYR